MSKEEAVKKEMVETKPEAVETKPVVETKPETAEQAIEQDTKRAGVKDAVVDADTVAIEKEKTQEPAKAVIPSFFVDEVERRRIEVDVLSIIETGKIVSVSRAGLMDVEKDFPFLSYRKEWFEFTVPSYENMTSYRQQSGVWNRAAGQMLVDRLHLRYCFLYWHLKDWSLTDKEGKKVELAFDKDGSLNAESLKTVYLTHAAILDIVLTAFEKDILLV